MRSSLNQTNSFFLSLFVLSTVVVLCASSIETAEAQMRWRDVNKNSVVFDNNGESANTSIVGKQIRMEMLSNANTTVLRLRQGIAKKATAFNIRYRLQGCATTPVATQLSAAMGTQSSGTTVVVGSHVVNHQERKHSSALTAFTGQGTSSSVLAESSWALKWLVAGSTVDITTKFNRTRLNTAVELRHSSTGTRVEGTANLKLPGRLGVISKGLLIFSPLLPEALNDACTIVITKLRAFY